MGFYVIGIGGTGAKCLEAIIQLTAVGLMPTNSLKLLFIDADETNGNLKRTKQSLSYYNQCYNLLRAKREECRWMSTEIQAYPLWSPFGNTSEKKDLGSFFYYKSLQVNNPPLADLFSVLFTEQERQVTLDVGFRGRPGIGSAIFSKIDLDNLKEEPWRSFLEQVKADSGSGAETKILLCGSIFGGTGAAGLPTLGKLIANSLEKAGIRDKVQIGCIFMLPYFNFAPGGEETVYARSELFLLNTESALIYYEEQAEQFDTKYLLGNQEQEQVKNFSIGKESQKNQPHFVELYAGLAARHFFFSPPHKAVNLISRSSSKILQWQDLPDYATVKTQVVTAARFAVMWLSYFQRELSGKDVKALDNLSWFQKFFSGKGFLGKETRTHLPSLTVDQQQDAIAIINQWCQDYLRWLKDIHTCNTDNIQLLRAKENFANIQNLQWSQLPNLFFEDPRSEAAKIQDNQGNFQNKLGEIDATKLAQPNSGTAGLAKALYLMSEIK